MLTNHVQELSFHFLSF